MSEAELQSRVNKALKIVEETQRGKVPHEILDEMLAIMRECAMPPTTGKKIEC